MSTISEQIQRILEATKKPTAIRGVTTTGAPSMSVAPKINPTSIPHVSPPTPAPVVPSLPIEAPSLTTTVRQPSVSEMLQSKLDEYIANNNQTKNTLLDSIPKGTGIDNLIEQIRNRSLPSLPSTDIPKPLNLTPDMIQKGMPSFTPPTMPAIPDFGFSLLPTGSPAPTPSKSIKSDKAAIFGSPGLPGSLESKTYAAKNMTTVKSGSAYVQVRKDAAPYFQGFLDELQARGYKLDPKTTGGYNSRWVMIDGKPQVGNLSNHAYGTAIDVNWNSNVQGKKTSTLPPDIRELAAKYNLKWGGDFKKHPDPMHFEFTGSLPNSSAPIANTSNTSNETGLNPALKTIIQQESGGKTTTKNPKSTAFGLGQLIIANRKAYGKKLGFDPGTTDANQQLAMTQAYIKDRYGTPEEALAFRNRHGWY